MPVGSSKRIPFETKVSKRSEIEAKMMMPRGQRQRAAFISSKIRKTNPKKKQQLSLEMCLKAPIFIPSSKIILDSRCSFKTKTRIRTKDLDISQERPTKISNKCMDIHSIMEDKDMLDMGISL